MAVWEAAGQSDEWYTPKYIFDALGCRFDLDVAHPLGVKTNVPCGGYLSQAHDGLAAEWFGFVWMNPPFGGRNAIAPWLGKFFAHRNGIALTPDRTSAPWFREAWSSADLCLFMPKVRFIRPDGSEGKSPSTGTTLWASGPLAVEALHCAHRAGLGILAQPVFDIPTHTPLAPAREVVTLPARPETHTPLQGRAGLSAHNQSHASEVSHV